MPLVQFITSYNSSSVEIFPGVGHNYGGCHADTLALSLGGSVNITLSKEGEVDGGSSITVSAAVQGFTEAAGQTIVLGFSATRGNNDKFIFDPGYIGTVSVDSSGNAPKEDFTVTVPADEGKYILTIEALSGGDGYETLNWTYSSVEITVAAASNEAELNVILTILIGTIASVGALVIVSALVIKFNITKNRLIE